MGSNKIRVKVTSSSIFDYILRAFEEGGGSACPHQVFSNDMMQIFVQSEGDSFDFRVAAWPMERDLYSGGRKFRVRPRFGFDIGHIPDGTPLYLGYAQELGVFVGFRPDRMFDRSLYHSGVETTVLHKAVQHGIAFGIRYNTESQREPLVAIRSDFLLYYSTRNEAIHRVLSKPPVFAVLASDSLYSNPFEEVKNLPEEDQYVVKDIVKKVRTQKFKIAVSNAYNRRCALTRVQLGLTVACHIFPFEYLGATNDVTNGIYLCPNFHKAFDDGLVYLDTAFVMHINDRKYNELDRAGMGGGYDYLRSYIPEIPQRILLPQDERQWPANKMILKGLMARGIVKAARKPPAKRTDNP